MAEEKKQFTENDRIFYSDGYLLAQSAIQEGLSEHSLFQAIASLYSEIDKLNDSILAYAEKQNMKVDCFKGCHWCCHQAVFASSYEIHFLSDHISKNFYSAEISGFIIRSKEKYSSTSKLTDKDKLNYKSPCPLLKNGVCSVYEARPLACRIYLSINLESCMNFFHHPEDEANYPQLLDFPLKAGRFMNEGFRAALKEHGVETAEFSLEEGLAILFKA